MNKSQKNEQHCIKQNEKSFTQKDLSLTEQWKKWQLESFRWYYVKFKTGDIDICWLTEWSNDELGTGGQYFDGIKDENILEVLAPVPSYDECMIMKDCAKAVFEAAQRETILKELLKECQILLKYLPIDDYDNKGLILDEKIDEVLK